MLWFLFFLQQWHVSKRCVQQMNVFSAVYVVVSQNNNVACTLAFLCVFCGTHSCFCVLYAPQFFFLVARFAVPLLFLCALFFTCFRTLLAPLHLLLLFVLCIFIALACTFLCTFALVCIFCIVALTLKKNINGSNTNIKNQQAAAKTVATP